MGREKEKATAGRKGPSARTARRRQPVAQGELEKEIDGPLGKNLWKVC